MNMKVTVVAALILLLNTPLYAAPKKITRRPNFGPLNIGCKYLGNSQKFIPKTLTFNYSDKTGYSGSQDLYAEGDVKVTVVVHIESAEVYLVSIQATHGKKTIQTTGTTDVSRLVFRDG